MRELSNPYLSRSIYLEEYDLGSDDGAIEADLDDLYKECGYARVGTYQATINLILKAPCSNENMIGTERGSEVL